MQRTFKGIALSLAVASAAGACGGSQDDGPLGDVQALVILQRQARNATGNVFAYDSYIPGAKLVQLSPPTADGVVTNLCCDQDPAFADVDISGYDLSFDAGIDENGVKHGQVVISAKRNSSEAYGLFIMSLDTGAIEQLPTNPARHYVAPVWAPGGKIIFTTTANVEGNNVPQFEDEYERQTTMQLGVINVDGTGEILYPRNLSHRVFPAMRSDGRVMFTQWDHLGPQNNGHIMVANPDGTALSEGFGKEDTGVANSIIKPIEVSPGRLLAIATSRDRTIQSGAIIDVRLGDVRELTQNETIDGIDWPKGSVVAEKNQAEANATVRILTTNVPLDRTPSMNQVGRYYDAYPLNAKDYADILVSWADGPVESGTLAAAGLVPDFGIYLFDSKRGTREPILNSPAWDIFPRPLRPRGAPRPIEPAQPDQYAGPTSTLMGSMNVYDSSLPPVLAPGSMYGVRIVEGLSSDEGFPRDFGTTEFEGREQLGVAKIADDNSWAAIVPANIPLEIQVIDKFGLMRKSEPVWTSGRPGEARICGGCHQDRTKTTVVQPGLLHAVVQGPVRMFDTALRDDRMSTTYTRDGAVGAPWAESIQPIFNARCVSCHGPGSTNGWAVDLVDRATGQSVRFNFELSGDPVNIAVGELMVTGYSKSYISMAGFMMRALDEANVDIVPVRGTYVPGMLPKDYANSSTGKRLNPVQQYPTQDTNIRVMMPGDPNIDAVHNDLGLTADEHMMLQLAADMGAVNWFYRENKPTN